MGSTRVLDWPLAATGRVAVAIGRHGRRALWAVVMGLVTLSIIPALIVGSTRQPVDVTFRDLRANTIPAATSWVRLTGDLRPLAGFCPNTYTLHDLQDDSVSVVVVAPSPLTTGHTDVTGRISGTISPRAGFATIEADAPAEPARHDPWLLFGVPALLAILVLVGRRLGYPVVRRDPARRSRAVALPPGAALPARWSGWIGNETAPLDAMRSCTVTVVGDADVCQLTIAEAGSARTVSTRRASPKRRLRVCWTGRRLPALQIHGPSADVMLILRSADDRDRLAAALG